jgi:U3 small nucleolar RNA-associated protein 5
MPAAVSSRSRKADGALSSEPATKKQRVVSREQPKKSLKDAIFTNGAPKKLEAKKATAPQTKSSHVVQDAKSTISTTVGQRPVTKQVDVVEISSDSSSSDDEDEEDDEEVEAEAGSDDEESLEEEEESPSDKENRMDTDDAAADEPTFGELLQTAPIDVQAALQFADDTAVTPLAPHQSSRKLVLSSTTSLATVLAQALKTNDRDLLETCFTTNDLESVRSTISRLQSPLVGQLLLYIADKLHKRPGRASNLMVWIQWSLVSHGGYLARRPDVVDKLGALNRVIRERANGLQPLMVLKGKLDMLSAQMELRREMMEANRKDQEDDDDVVIYVEGQEDLDIRGKGADIDDSEEEDDLDLDESAMTGALDDDEDEDDEEDGSDDDDVSEDGFSDQQVDEDSEVSDMDDDSDEEALEAIKPVDKGKKRKL